MLEIFLFLLFFRSPNYQPKPTRAVLVQEFTENKDQDPVVFPEPSCFGPKGDRYCY